MTCSVLPRGVRLLLIASLTFNLGFGVTWIAGWLQRGPDGEPPAGMACLHEQLGLSAEQQDRLDQSTRDLLGRIGDLQVSLQTEREALGDLLTEPEPDRQTVAARLDAIASLRRQAEELLVEHLLHQKTLLTPAQRATFDEIIRGHVCPKRASCATDRAAEGTEPCGHGMDPPGE